MFMDKIKKAPSLEAEAVYGLHSKISITIYDTTASWIRIFFLNLFSCRRK